MCIYPICIVFTLTINVYLPYLFCFYFDYQCVFTMFLFFYFDYQCVFTMLLLFLL